MIRPKRNTDPISKSLQDFIPITREQKILVALYRHGPLTSKQATKYVKGMTAQNCTAALSAIYGKLYSSGYLSRERYNSTRVFQYKLSKVEWRIIWKKYHEAPSRTTITGRRKGVRLHENNKREPLTVPTLDLHITYRGANLTIQVGNQTLQLNLKDLQGE